MADPAPSDTPRWEPDLLLRHLPTGDYYLTNAEGIPCRYSGTGAGVRYSTGLPFVAHEWHTEGRLRSTGTTAVPDETAAFVANLLQRELDRFNEETPNPDDEQLAHRNRIEAAAAALSPHPIYVQIVAKDGVAWEPTQTEYEQLDWQHTPVDNLIRKEIESQLPPFGNRRLKR